MSIRAFIFGAILGVMPRRWRNWVLSTLATIVVVSSSFFVDALNTPSDPTFEQYTGHSARTSLLVALGAVWVLGTLLFTIALSLSTREHYVPFPEPVVPSSQQTVETTATEQPDWVAEEWVKYRAEQRAAAIRAMQDRMDERALATPTPQPVEEDDPDAEYKILREAADKIDALRNRQS